MLHSIVATARAGLDELLVLYIYREVTLGREAEALGHIFLKLMGDAFG